MRTVTLAFLALTLPAFAACGQDRAPAAPPPPPRAQVLKDVPVFPGSIVTDTTGTVDAEQRQFMVQARFDSVRAFYRERLPLLRWQFRGGRGGGTEEDMLTQRGDTSLWLHIESLGALASQYRLIGSVARRPPAPGDSGRVR